jgi:hypothetical protein
MARGIKLAEAQGFEPWIPCGMLVFKTSAIDHSAKLPFLLCTTNFKTGHSTALPRFQCLIISYFRYINQAKIS